MSNIAHRRSPLLNIIIWGLVLIWIIAASFPFFWTLWGSLKVQGDFFLKSRLDKCYYWSANAN